ncbi:hypothetical protein ACE1CD_06505 [Aerosakkonema sp. BLCC-F183]
MGPRASGKTTYLASLVAISLKERLSGVQIRPSGAAVDKLKDLVVNFIKEKINVPPTPPEEEISYRFDIEFTAVKRVPKNTKLELSIKDYSGERLNDLFKDITKEQLSTNQKKELQNFLDDCFRVDRWLVMLSEWEPGKDKEVYEPIFEKLCNEIDGRQKKNKAIRGLRIAVVMTKCERGEIWTGRLEPEEDLFKVRLPSTYSLLKRRLIPNERLRFFACSSFGVMGDRDPRPNRYINDNDGTPAEYRCVLQDYQRWQPYGVIAPLYWLTTGQELQNECL